MKPAIKVEGQVVALGSRTVSIGEGHYFVVDFIEPGDVWVDRVYHDVTAGGYYALGLDTTGNTKRILDERYLLLKAAEAQPVGDPLFNDERLGERLYLSAQRYFNSIHIQAADIDAEYFYEGPFVRTTNLASVLSNVYIQDISEALTGQYVSFYYDTAGILHFRLSSWFIDAPRVINGLISTDGNELDWIQKIKMLGITSSYLENRLWEKMVSLDAISTIKGLQYAITQGIPIYTLDQSNLNILLPTMNVSDATKYYVTLAVNQGLVVTIPKDTLYYKQWVGSVWVQEDPKTYAAGYLILGEIYGGSTIEDRKGQRPRYEELSTELFSDLYRAVAYTESNWRQYADDGKPYSNGKDYGIMQINEFWKGTDPKTGENWFAKLTGGNPINWDAVLYDWATNVLTGMIIMDDAINRAFINQSINVAHVPNILLYYAA